MKRTILILVAIAFAFSSTLTSCKKDKDVTGVSLSETTLSLKVGDTKTLTANVSPSDADDKSVTWTSSNATVATVSNGTVTAKAEGTTTITVTTTDGGFKATCTVTVETGGVVTEPKITVKFGDMQWTASVIEAEEYSSDSVITILAAEKNFSSYPIVYLETINETGSFKENDFFVEYYESMTLTDGTNQYGDWWMYSGSITITRYSGGKFTSTVDAVMFDAYSYLVAGNDEFILRNIQITFESIDITNAKKMAKVLKNSIERSKNLIKKQLILEKVK